MLGAEYVLLFFILSHTVFAIKPNDPYFYKQWACYNDGTFKFNNELIATSGADMGMLKTWDIKQGDSAIIVAILDSGLKFDHPEFANRIWKNIKEIPANGKDDDNNGFIDNTIGWDFGDNDNNPADEIGHGTAIAGIVAANANNGIGVAGIDWYCKLMVCKVTDSIGAIPSSRVAKAIQYATLNGANVIVMALGNYQKSGIAESSAVSEAYKKNIVIVAGSGNDNKDSIFYPAALEESICVGSTDPNDKRSIPFIDGEAGSNYGPELDIVAPGNGIIIIDINTPNEYKSFVGGTSSATTQVAGVVSLLLAQDKTRTPERIKNILYKTADDQIGDPSEDTQGWDKYYGWGRVNAHKALTYQENHVVNNFYTVRKNSLQKTMLVVAPKTGLALVSVRKNGVANYYNVYGQKVNASALLK